MTITDCIQIVLMVILVVTTGIYAWRTFAISKATEKQAHASVEMAEEMKEQRYSESLPLLVPDVIKRDVVARKLKPNEVDYETLQTGVGIEVMWHNLGKGVAINSRFSFWTVPLDSHPGKVLYFPPRESNFLEIGGRKEIIFMHEWGEQLYPQPKAYLPRLEAEYQDIHERRITTVQEFRIEEQDNNKKAFIGELYFTVNGRRLGREIDQHD